MKIHTHLLEILLRVRELHFNVFLVNTSFFQKDKGFDICLTMHHSYNNINNQINATISVY